MDERDWAPLPEYQLRRKKAVHIDPVAIIGILTAIFLMITMMVGVTKLVDVRDEAVRLEAQVAQLQAKNHNLSQEYSEGYNLKVIENTALNMGMIPMAEAENITIQVTMPPVEQPQSVTLWDQFTTFLTGLFA